MADHSKPTNTSLYTDYTSEIDSRFDDITIGLDPALTTASNLPIGAIRWNSASNKWEKWSGSSWANLSSLFVFPSLTTTGNTILGSTSANTLNVGNGDLIKDASGNVGIKKSPTFTLDVNGGVNSSAAGFYSAGIGVISSDGSATYLKTNSGLYIQNTSSATVAYIDTTGSVTTTGNTTLGNASTDTLNVGNGGLVKDAAGNVGIGTATPTGLFGTGLQVGSTSTTSIKKVYVAGEYNFEGAYLGNSVPNGGAALELIAHIGTVDSTSWKIDHNYDVTGDDLVFAFAPITSSYGSLTYASKMTLSYTGVLTTTAYTTSGNLTFTGTGNRIRGDFTNATTDSRASFQTSTTNGGTFVGAIPNGTSALSSFTVFNNSATTNSSWGALNQTGTTTQVIAGKNGTGSYGDLEFWANNIKQGYFPTGGGFITAGSIQVAKGIGAGDANIELGSDRTADGPAYIDFHSASGSSDYKLRIIRNGGTDASANFINLGTGGITLSNNNITSLYIDQAHNSQFPFGAVMPYAPTHASISAATTLTNANLQTQIINTTGTSYTLTLPTGATLETIANWVAFNIGYDFTIINTASGTITIGANGNTTLGGLTIPTGTSAQFRIRRTAVNTFTIYRLR